ncbi:MAG: GspMb/PilO family protein [Pseudohongiella sp.]|nr:GspMb/PilO family protein [Pseudohongiella sp.]
MSLLRKLPEVAVRRPLLQREKRILGLAAFVAVVFLLTNGVPALLDVFRSRNLQIENLRADIDREQRLIDGADGWAQRRADAEQRLSDIESSLFTAGSAALLAAAIQRQAREIGSENGLIITSVSLAESNISADWLMVEQTMSFALGDQNSMLRFLNALKQSEPFLGVSSLDLRRNRNQYIGEITVVGFSRLTTSTQSEE